MRAGVLCEALSVTPVRLVRDLSPELTADEISEPVFVRPALRVSHAVYACPREARFAMYTCGR